MKDILTPRERFGMLVIDEKPDRFCVIPLVTSHAATVARMKLKRYYTRGTAMAKAQIAAYEEYGMDAISIFSEVGIIAEAMGSEFIYPDNDLPKLSKPALKKLSLEGIKIPDAKKDGRLPVYLDAIKYAYRAIGDIVPILAYIPAPFTTGTMLCEASDFFINTIRNPDFVKEILELSLKVTIEFCYDVIDAGALPIIVDPSASCSVISPKIYRDFALPYERRLIDFLHRYDFDVILHICGETEPIFDLLPQTGADLISLDKVSISIAIEKLASKMRLIGNYSTSKLAFGSPETINLEVATMVRLAKYAKKGYIAATGCEVPIKAPVENVRAFINAAKESGHYWE